MKAGATTVCGNVNLCAGLRAGIEGNLHAVRAVWPQSAGWECNGGEVTALQPATEGTSMATILTTDPGKAADTSRLHYVPDSSFRTALFDAKNGFNKLNQYLMLWTAAHCLVCLQPIPPPECSLCLQPVGRRGTNQLHLLERYLDVLVKHITEIPPPTALVEGVLLR